MGPFRGSCENLLPGCQGRLSGAVRRYPIVDRITRLMHLVLVAGLSPLLLWWLSIADDAEHGGCRVHPPLGIDCSSLDRVGVGAAAEASVLFVLFLILVAGSWPVIALGHRRWPAVAGTLLTGFAAISAIAFANTNADHLPEVRWMVLTAALVALASASIAVVRVVALRRWTTAG